MNHKDINKNGPSVKTTYFASPERSNKKEIYSQIDAISINPVINELLRIAPNYLAILNSNRQIITINRSLLVSLGLENASELLGLRLGEAYKCVYSSEMPAGCGTSKYCISCGAAISIVTALEGKITKEAYCTISTRDNGSSTEYFFQVRASRLTIDGQNFILLFLYDKTKEQKRAYIERTFFNDINNLIQTLNNIISHSANSKEDYPTLIENINNISGFLSREVEIQKALLNSDYSFLKPVIHNVSVNDVFNSLSNIFENHPQSKSKQLSIDNLKNDIILRSDSILITKILIYMLHNAFESAIDDRIIRLWTEDDDNNITFKVWNDSYIPEAIAARIFQKYFSTKEGMGYGLGTYSMKLLGEKILNGKISFKTTKKQGTVFEFSLPKK